MCFFARLSMGITQILYIGWGPYIFVWRLALPQAFICIKKTQLFDCTISIFHNVLIHLLSLAC